MTIRSFLFIGLLVVPFSLTLAQEQPASSAAARSVKLAAAPQASLYERLGGVYPISVVVDDFIERLLVNDILNTNPAIREARQRVPRQGLKFHLTTQVCQVTGGPCQYTGRDMRVAHAHLRISEREWQAMLADFRASLNRFNVPAAEQDELVNIVNSTKADIVTTP